MRKEKKRRAAKGKGKREKRSEKKKKNFSPCDQHRQELVAELPVGHRQAGLGVSRLEHRIEEALFLFCCHFDFVFVLIEKDVSLLRVWVGKKKKKKKLRKSIGIKVLVYCFVFPPPCPPQLRSANHVKGVIVENKRSSCAFF